MTDAARKRGPEVRRRDSGQVTVPRCSGRAGSGHAWRGVLFVCGSLALTLGFVGVFVPLLPTTPLVLLAAACYARASSRAHGWLLGNPWFGPLLRQWRENRAVPLSAKITAMGLIGASFAATLLLVPNCIYGYVTLLLVGSGLVVIVASLPSAPKALADRRGR